MQQPENESSSPELHDDVGDFTRRDFVQVSSIAAGAAAFVLSCFAAAKLSGKPIDRGGAATMR